MTQETAERLESTLPDDPEFDEVPSERERVFVATPRQLMWWRFRRHKMALLSSVVLILLYLAALTWEFLAPYDPLRHDVQSAYAPPQRLQFFDEEGFHFPPFVYGLKGGRDPETFRKIFEVDKSVKHPIKLMVHGDPYKFWGLMETDLHLFGLESNEGTVFLLGADRLGRDVLSRLLAATRISVSIGLVGVILSFVPGYFDRGHLRLLRRHGRHIDPAHHRVHSRDAQHPALAGPERGDSQRLAGDEGSISRLRSFSP